MEFKDIAAVAGKGGLFKIVSPTRNGVILEALDETKKKLVAGLRTKVSVLSDISIYTTDGEGAVPLEEVMKSIHKEFQGDSGLTSSSDASEMKAFLKHVLSNYDEDRVYVSDIKKLIIWYNKISAEFPELLETVEEKEVKPAKTDAEDK